MITKAANILDKCSHEASGLVEFGAGIDGGLGMQAKLTRGNLLVANPATTNEQFLHGDCLELMRSFPDSCIDLAILDPPYWKIIAEKWDCQWRTLEDWCKEWLLEVARVCRKNGSLHTFGHVSNLIILHQIIEGMGFDFRRDITISKGMRSLGGRKTSTSMMFPNTTESLWFFRRDVKLFVKALLKERQQEVGLTAKEINQKLGVKVNGGGVWSLYTGNNILAQVPTAEMWQRLQEVLEFEYPYQEV